MKEYIKKITKFIFWLIFTIILIGLVIFVGIFVYNKIFGQISGISPGAGAVRSLKSPWQQETIYKHNIGYPSYVNQDGDGNTLIASRRDNKILKLASDGTMSTYLDASSLKLITTFAYQPGLDRLIIATQAGSLYAYDAEFNILKRFGFMSSSLSVDSRDDSFYSCSQNRRGKVNHYDANGKFLETLASEVAGCFQLSVDEKNNKLYYTETFTGNINEIDLTTNTKNVIGTGFGVPGTSEPIALAHDDENNLYIFTASQGLNRYQNGAFIKIMNSIAGVGPMSWSSDYQAFMVGNAVGANVISYNPETRQTAQITPYINSTSIVEMDNGTILTCEGDDFGTAIRKVDQTGFSAFTKELGVPCSNLERDDNGNIYAGLVDGSIWKIGIDGSANRWASGFEPGVSGLSYDSKNSVMVVAIGNHNRSSAVIWRIPINNPKAAERVIDLAKIKVIPTLPAITVDNQGNIYILERKENVIYKIADGANTKIVFASRVLDSEAITVPRLEYISKENGLLVSTIDSYELWSLDTASKTLFAKNNGDVDNFGINETKNGDIIAIHAGRVFRFIFEK